jgi:hypothetical protein
MASIVSAGTTSATALNMSADTSGVLQLASNNGTTAATIDTSQNMTLVGSLSAPNTFGFKNRIINGNMAIDQRNAGAVVTPTSGGYTLDRWAYYSTQASKFTVQQTPSATETGYAVRVTAGFQNYLAMTVASAVTVGASDFFCITQAIEGFNIADLAWGTSSAKTITLSFLVYSSLTGTFGGILRNSGASRSYPFTYTVSSANTWTQISVTIAGDTSGTWLINNGVGILVAFGLGAGSTYSGTAGAWASANYLSATGAVSVVGTSGATFYITGVQLEKGSTATSFDFRPYGTELALCQRYFCKNSSTNVVATNGAAYSTTGMFSSGAFNAYVLNAGYVQWIHFPVFMRTEPATITLVNTNLPTSPTSGAWSIYNIGSGWANGTGAVQSFTTSGFGLNMAGTWAAGPSLWYGAWTSSAEL